MMRWVQIEDPGETTLLEGDTTDRWEFIDANDDIFDKKVVNQTNDSTKLKSRTTGFS